MKSNLILAQYQTTPVIGTFSTLEDKTFLGSKMLEIEDSIIIEIKAVEQINPVWEAQIISQLKLLNKDLGFLINFNVPLIKSGIRRFINTKRVF